MAQVFTSYSRRDTETVDTVVGEMSQAGIDVWIDRQDIKAGDNWRVQIVKAIKACPAFVLMLSPSSAASDNVRKEIDLSQSSNRPIFALKLEPMELPDEISYQLAGLQFIDVKKLGFDNAVDRLVDTLKEHLEKLGLTVEPVTRQAEIVIQGIDLKSFTADKQAQLLDFLAQLTSADRSQLQIANLAAGSVHVFVDMPADPAYLLVTRALNRDERFKKLGIVSLRLDGDTKFVNTTSGAFTSTATESSLKTLWSKIPALFAPFVGVPVGQLLTILLGAVFIVGATLVLPLLGPRGAASEPSRTPTPLSTPTFTPPSATETPTSTSLPTAADTPSPTETFAQTATPTPSPIATETFTPEPVFSTLNGEVINRTPCYYGPGDLDIYQPRFGLAPTNRIEIQGQMEVWNGRELETWLWGLPEFFPNECWINARNVELNGEFSSLEMIYPEKVDLPFIRKPRWPTPQNVQVTRLGDQVMITWDFFEVPQGEDAESGPPYILETWICRDGQLLFYPIPVYKPSVVVIDQAGCAEPSHGRIILAEKHGYEGPLELKWPPYIIPQ